MNRNSGNLGLFLHILGPFLHNMPNRAKISPYSSNMTKNEAIFPTVRLILHCIGVVPQMASFFYKVAFY